MTKLKPKAERALVLNHENSASPSMNCETKLDGHRTIRTGIIAAAILSATLVALLWSQKSPQLVDISKRVYLAADADMVLWLSKKSLLIGKHHTNRWTWETRGIANKTVQPWPNLDKELNPDNHTRIIPSPDGNSVLWNDEESGKILVSTLGHVGTVSWPFNWTNGPFGWLGGNSGWVQFDESRFDKSGAVGGSWTATIHSLSRTTADKKIELPLDNTVLGPTILKSNRIFWHSWINPDISGPDCQIFEAQLLPLFRVTGKFNFRLPASLRVLSSEVSPDGKQVLWWVITDHSQSRNVMRKLSELLFGKQPASEAVWLSNTDGSHLRELGYIHKRESIDQLELSSVHWLPDCSGISYAYRKNIYFVQI